MSTLCKFTTAHGAEKILAFNTIFITSPLNLNDPFEMRPAWTNSLEMSQYEDRQLGNAMTGGLYGAQQPIPVEHGFGIADHHNQEVFEELHRHFRVLSLLPPILDPSNTYGDSKAEDVLMWAHYGDNNQGVCLILDTEKFNNGDQAGGYPVEYKDERNSMPPDRYQVWSRLGADRGEVATQARHESLYNAYIGILTRKSPQWEHEREIRMIYSKGERNPIDDFGMVELSCPVCAGRGRPLKECNHPCHRDTIKMPTEAILGVVFGADCPSEYGDPILKVLAAPRYAHVKVYRSALHASEYFMQYMEHSREHLKGDLLSHTKMVGLAKHHYRSDGKGGMTMPPWGARKTINFKSEPKGKLRRKITEINIATYVEGGISVEPSIKEVFDAIAFDNLETRDFQLDLPALKAEWEAMCQTPQGLNLALWVHVVREYHSRRVAFFVVNGWDDPIRILPNGDISDGSHRLRAAMYKGMQEVEIEIS